MITALPRIAIAAGDFPALLARFRDDLGLPVVDLSPWSAAQLGARLAMCVPHYGSPIELMSPADPAAPLAQSLSRFLARRGDGLFALMLEAPDPNAEAEAIAARGLDVLPLMPGASGRDLHPRTAHGVLIRVYPCSSYVSEPSQIARAPGRALGLSGIVRAVIAVRDAKRAADTYARRIGLALRGIAHDAARGARVATVAAPEGPDLALAEPTDSAGPFAAAIALQLATTGEGLHALVLQAPDPAHAAKALAARGLAVEPLAGKVGAFAIAPASAFGARIWIEPAAR